MTTTSGQRMAPARAGRPSLRAAAKFGDFVVTYLEHGRVTFGSDSSLFARGPETARLCIVLAGSIRLSYEGARETLGSRDAALLRPGTEVAYGSDGPARVLVCDIPSTLPALAAVTDTVPYALVRASAALPSALAAFLLDSLRQDARGMTTEGRRTITDVLSPMVSSMVTTMALTGSTAWEPEQRRQTALRVIATHFADPELTSESVARLMGLSRRTLQRLFEDDTRSVQQYIHEARTQHAVSLIQDPQYANATLEDIATLSGFGSVVGMRRAVTEATGFAPSVLRAQAALIDVA